MLSLRKGLALASAVGLMGAGAAPALAAKTAPASSLRAAGPNLVVSTAAVSNPTNSQSFGSVQCPTGDYRTGGGVFGFAGLAQNINSSYPSGNGWAAFVNNTGPATSFTVYAVCLA